MFLFILVYWKCKKKKKLYNLRQVRITDGKIMKIIKNKMKEKISGQNQESRSKGQLLHLRLRRKSHQRQHGGCEAVGS